MLLNTCLCYCNKFIQQQQQQQQQQQKQQQQQPCHKKAKTTFCKFGSLVLTQYIFVQTKTFNGCFEAIVKKVLYTG